MLRQYVYKPTEVRSYSRAIAKPLPMCLTSRKLLTLPYLCIACKEEPLSSLLQQKCNSTYKTHTLTSRRASSDVR